MANFGIRQVFIRSKFTTYAKDETGTVSTAHSYFCALVAVELTWCVDKEVYSRAWNKPTAMEEAMAGSNRGWLCDTYCPRL